MIHRHFLLCAYHVWVIKNCCVYLCGTPHVTFETVNAVMFGSGRALRRTVPQSAFFGTAHPPLERTIPSHGAHLSFNARVR